MKTTYKTNELKDRTHLLRINVFDGTSEDIRPTHLQLLKVNRTHAEKLYNSGHTVYFHPCRMRLNNMWQSPMEAQRTTDRPEAFNVVESQYRYYNCDTERGRYPSYFAILNYAGDNKYQIVKEL